MRPTTQVPEWYAAMATVLMRRLGWSGADDRERVLDWWPSFAARGLGADAIDAASRALAERADPPPRGQVLAHLLALTHAGKNGPAAERERLLAERAEQIASRQRDRERLARWEQLPEAEREAVRAKVRADPLLKNRGDDSHVFRCACLQALAAGEGDGD